MTSQQLDEMLSACEECAGGDVRSYEEHFAACPECKEYAEAAEKLKAGSAWTLAAARRRLLPLWLRTRPHPIAEPRAQA